jgi:signal peptidase I
MSDDMTDTKDDLQHEAVANGENPLPDAPSTPDEAGSAPPAQATEPDPLPDPEEIARREAEEREATTRQAREERLRLEQEAEERHRRKVAASQRRLKVMLPVLVILTFLVYAFTTNYIPSDSMQPTLRPGDHILTMRSWLAYPRNAMPKVGDIIVFVQPASLSSPDDATDPGTRPKLFLFREEAKELLIKRVAALPGQTVQVSGEQVYVNGKLQRARHAVFPVQSWATDDVRYGGARPLKLGPDEIFVLGDNRDVSEDSRYFGPIKRSDIVGRFVTVLWNEGAAGLNERRVRNLQ